MCCRQGLRAGSCRQAAADYDNTCDQHIVKDCMGLLHRLGGCFSWIERFHCQVVCAASAFVAARQSALLHDMHSPLIYQWQAGAFHPLLCYYFCEQLINH